MLLNYRHARPYLHLPTRASLDLSIGGGLDNSLTALLRQYRHRQSKIRGRGQLREAYGVGGVATQRTMRTTYRDCQVG